MSDNNVVNQYPQIESISFLGIEKSFLKLQLSLAGLLAFVLLIGIGFAWFNLPDNMFIEFLVISTGIMLVVIVLFLYLIIGFKKRQYAVREKDISYQSGLFFHSLTTVPYVRIQHIEVGEGPLERFFKLGTLNIYTAGDNGRDLKISGLTKDKALEIKSYISKELNDSTL